MWEVEKKDDSNYPDRVTVNFPSGFKFDLNEPLKDGIKLLAELVRRGSVVSLPDGQILNLNVDGNLSVFDIDPWINEGYEFGQTVGNATGIAFVLANYLTEEIKEDE